MVQFMLAFYKYRKASRLEFAWCQHKAANDIPVNEAQATFVVYLFRYCRVLDGGIYIDEDPIVFEQIRNERVVTIAWIHLGPPRVEHEPEPMLCGELFKRSPCEAGDRAAFQEFLRRPGRIFNARS